ncbi:MAG: hypothetical protein VB858_07915, partial [Planctomycetaceae bacterium]
MDAAGKELIARRLLTPRMAAYLTRSFAMLRRFIVTLVPLLVLSALTPDPRHQYASAGNLPDQDSLQSLVALDRGLCLLVGETSASRIADLAESTSLTIVVQCIDMTDVRQLQAELDQKRLLGTRVYVSQIENGRLCLAGNLASVVVADGNDIAHSELIRVLRPRGRLLVDGRTVIKPVPEGTGEWTHPYQDAANNPLAGDRLATAPYLTKFLSAPYYGPMPEITLSSGGRLFKAFGHLAFKEREWPMLGKLIAMDGYNGTLLWERDMEPGFMIHR